jgi:cytochrome bd-type quinol oxidase subunit 2
MKILLTPFIALAAVGLILSLIVHLSALLSLPVPLGHRAWALHMGIFVVWLPTVAVANFGMPDLDKKKFWRNALRGCPEWFRYMTYGLFGYAVINFGIFMVRAAGNPRGSSMSEEASLIGFSGHWMAFYAAALGVLWSFARMQESDFPRCPNGHPASSDAKFCQECGSPIQAGQPREQSP